MSYLTNIESKYQKIKQKEEQLYYIYSPFTQYVSGKPKHRFIRDIAEDFRLDKKHSGIDPFSYCIF